MEGLNHLALCVVNGQPYMYSIYLTVNFNMHALITLQSHFTGFALKDIECNLVYSITVHYDMPDELKFHDPH